MRITAYLMIFSVYPDIMSIQNIEEAANDLRIRVDFMIFSICLPQLLVCITVYIYIYIYIHICIYICIYIYIYTHTNTYVYIYICIYIYIYIYTYTCSWAAVWGLFVVTWSRSCNIGAFVCLGLSIVNLVYDDNNNNDMYVYIYIYIYIHIY